MFVFVGRGSSAVERRTRNQESPVDTVSKFGHFRLLSCINEHLAIDSGGVNVRG